jgi:hypothetical protein
MKPPLDPYPYPPDTRTVLAGPGIRDGLYAYVQDERGFVHVLPDALHIHPKVLGNARPAMYAGDMRVEQSEVRDFTNLSGTFQFDDPDGLLAAAAQVEAQGLKVAAQAVRYFPPDGSKPRVLR